MLFAKQQRVMSRYRATRNTGHPSFFVLIARCQAVPVSHKARAGSFSSTCAYAMESDVFSFVLATLRVLHIFSHLLGNKNKSRRI